MRIRTYIASLLVTLVLGSGCGKQQTKAIELSSITLYQPDKVLEQRFGGADAEALSSYLQALVKEADAYWMSLPPIPAQSGEIVVAIRPNGRAKFWCEFSSSAISSDQLAGLRSHLARTPK